MVELRDDFDFVTAFSQTSFVLIAFGDGRGTEIVTGWGALQAKVNEEAGIDLSDPVYFDDWEWSDEKVSQPYHIHFAFEDGGLTIARLPATDARIAELEAVNADIGMMLRNATARVADLDAELARLRAALNGFGDDYMTSEHHHPGWVLIPTEQFERIRAEKVEATHVGWLYQNEDTGLEFSANHPIESGETTDATEVRPATADSLLPLLMDAWRDLNATRSTVARLRAAGTFNEGIEAALEAQPSTAEDPNESSYERGRFDGVIAYGHAIVALRRPEGGA